MIEKQLTEILKKYLVIFLKEYSNYLSRSQLETLKNIKFNDVIKIDKTENIFGDIKLGRIYFSNVTDELLNKMQKMPDYASKKETLHNKNLSSYLKYMCENGYNIIDYYSDILMYLIFKMVIKNDTPLIWGLVNQEIKYLSIKYRLRIVSLYAKEEMVVGYFTPYLKLDGCRKILFLDKVSSFKYLNDNYGYRYAKFILDIQEMLENEFKRLTTKGSSLQDFLNYTDMYDHLSYIDVFDYIIDFEAQNSLTN